ncbi:MAG: 30S ribosomal protein S8 [Deltaproteobacteria bacterium]|nr:30S ribosomal protein S8 [Deltaproteobacteria bacterium]
MTSTDPIADFTTRIRNAQKAGHASFKVPASRIKLKIAEILRDEGYLGDVAQEGTGPTRKLVVHLKYDKERVGVIDGIQRVSTPGMRVYRGHDDLAEVRGGMGMAILSTNKGLMTDKQARAEKVGGELLLRVW